MSMKTQILGGLALAALVATAAAPAVAKSSAERFGPPLAGADCFRQRDWQGWAPADDNTVYLGTRTGDVYKLGLYGRNNGVTNIDAPGRYLLTLVRGTDRICSAQDFDMKVVDRNTGAVIQLFPQTIAKLSDAETKALPGKLRSNLGVR